MTPTLQPPATPVAGPAGDRGDGLAALAARLPAWAVAWAVAAAAATGFLPWASSGEVTRSGYVLARTLRGAGLADGAPAGLLTAGVLLLPLLASVAWLGAALGRRAVVGTAALVAGALGAGAAGLVLTSGAVHARFGAVAGLVFAVLALAGGANLWWRMLPGGDDDGRHG